MWVYFACWYEANHCKGRCCILLMALNNRRRIEVTLVLKFFSTYGDYIVLLEKRDKVVCVLLARPLSDALSGQQACHVIP